MLENRSVLPVDVMESRDCVCGYCCSSIGQMTMMFLLSDIQCSASLPHIHLVAILAGYALVTPILSRGDCAYLTEVSSDLMVVLVLTAALIFTLPRIRRIRHDRIETLQTKFFAFYCHCPRSIAISSYSSGAVTWLSKSMCQSCYSVC